MIAVIADDFSGAAEVGGVGIRYGLTAEILSVPAECAADVVILNTNSRSCSVEEACKRVEAAGRFLDALRPDWMFMKVDSVLRGHILPELKAFMGAVKAKCALLVAGNPSLGRTVQSGRLLVEGIPVDQTFFAEDPQYPARTSNVCDLLDASDDHEVGMADLNASFPSSRIVTGNVAAESDLNEWAARAVENRFLPVGAASFFASLLEIHGANVKKAPDFSLSRCPKPVLCVNGSMSVPSRTVLRKLECSGVPILRIPDSLYTNAESVGGAEPWAQTVLGALDQHACAVAAIDRARSFVPGLSAALDGKVAQLMKMVVDSVELGHLFLEGGATAWAVTSALHLDRLTVLHEWGPGAVTMKSNEANTPLVTVKPGSYLWPESIIRFWLQKCCASG